MENLVEKYQIWVDGKPVSHVRNGRKATLLYKRALGLHSDKDVRLYQERANGLGLKQIAPKLVL